MESFPFVSATTAGAKNAIQKQILMIVLAWPSPHDSTTRLFAPLIPSQGHMKLLTNADGFALSLLSS